VNYLSKCKFYKKYGSTVDSTEIMVESSVFQSRSFHIKNYLYHFTSHGVCNSICQKSGLIGQDKRSKIFSTFSVYMIMTTIPGLKISCKNTICCRKKFWRNSRTHSGFFFNPWVFLHGKDSLSYPTL
jgi:hypothetical protein